MWLTWKTVLPDFSPTNPLICPLSIISKERNKILSSRKLNLNSRQSVSHCCKPRLQSLSTSAQLQIDCSWHHLPNCSSETVNKIQKRKDPWPSQPVQFMNANQALFHLFLNSWEMDGRFSAWGWINMCSLHFLRDGRSDRGSEAVCRGLLSDPLLVDSSMSWNT